jgi:hypothetical protein
MMHKHRCSCVGPIEDPAQLAEWLTQRSWTLCTGFAIAGYLFLNDATSEDGAQEYAVEEADESERSVPPSREHHDELV